MASANPVEPPAARADGAPRRVLVAGASGYIGRVLAKTLADRGHPVVALARPPKDAAGRARLEALAAEVAPAELRTCALLEPGSLQREGLRGEGFDAVYSCIASRSGGVQDAWRVEHDANLALLEAAHAAGASHFVLLSAICVQKPRLAFQHAKLAFEAALRASGLTWTIVRPTAYFKSLSGQIRRVRDGKPYLVLGDGRLNACKPIGEGDLARYLADCLTDPARRDAILPVGGPGPAVTPLDQGSLLFDALDRPPRFRHVPLLVLSLVAAALSAAGRLGPGLRDKAELARIGRYYATESMLVWDPARGAYDAAATPETGTETLRDFYGRVLAEGLERQRLGAHAVFDRGAS